MSNAPAEVTIHRDKSWPAADLNLPEYVPDFPRESFDSAPYPFAVMLGATTMLLLVATVRTLWLLFAN